MTLIKKNIEFSVLKAVELEKKTIEYFNKSGFKYIKNSNVVSQIKFERGSIVSNMWTFNPLNWKSEINIEIDVDNVKAEFIINTTGQIPTINEELLWEDFIVNYEKYLLDSNFDFIKENSISLRKTKGSSIKYIGWALLGAMIGGIPAGIMAYFTGINSIISLGAVCGSITLLTMKINEEKKKNVL